MEPARLAFGGWNGELDSKAFAVALQSVKPRCLVWLLGAAQFPAPTKRVREEPVGPYSRLEQWKEPIEMLV